MPLAQAQFSAGDVTVPYDKDRIKKAPSVPAEGHLSQRQEAELYRYYGLPYSDASSDSGLPTGVAGGGQRQPTGDAMTRSEERLRVGTEQVPTGRVRLRKYVETEQVQQSVPVTREQARVVREPITDANREQALEGPALSEDEHEITLREERPVVEKETVPVERFRLGKETVSEQQTVGGEVRKEVVETEGGERGAPPRR